MFKIARGAPGYDALFKARPLINHLNQLFTAVNNPNKDIVIDEGMIGWKGNLSFRVCFLLNEKLSTL